MEKTALDKVFNHTLTTNGDVAYKSLTNPLLDILFKAEYLRNNLSEVSIGNSTKEYLFSMFMRDPRYGMGQRVLGMELLKQAGADISDIFLCGRGDDLWKMFESDEEKFKEVCDYVYHQIFTNADNAELLKKWCPRFPSHNKYVENGEKHKAPLNTHQKEQARLARKIATRWGLNKQKYGKFIKAATVEQKLSLHNEDDINFEHVPSLASIKYAPTFTRNDKTKERYQKYLEQVRSGEKKINMSVTTVYDIYKNMKKADAGFDANLWFDKLEKISGSFLPIIDVSGSMYDSYDSIGKALSIGFYLSVCSTFCNNQFVTFSRQPQLVTLEDYRTTRLQKIFQDIANADWGGNTDLGAVMDLLCNLGEQPEYLVILSDMQFDSGSTMRKDRMMQLWKEKGYTTKIIWWNFCASSTATCPETDDMGNIFMSGYSPMLLKYLEAGFDGNMFLDKLLKTYDEQIGFSARLPEASV